jgi:hypothetical protein
MIRAGLDRPMHMKTLRSQKLRMLLTHRAKEGRLGRLRHWSRNDSRHHKKAPPKKQAGQVGV